MPTTSDTKSTPASSTTANAPAESDSPKGEPVAETQVTLDGNEACAYVAFRVNEVCAIYPITPSSAMAEFADQWASEGKRNIWGAIPDVLEMQSEAGAAGAVHGSLQAGALTTTFTASQGLMLMIPNMFRIAGELSPFVMHVAARALATQSLSIFGDHQDVMAVRQTGFAMLASSSVQEAHDMALVAQAATLASRVPFVHFFDGFRTSHEVNKLTLIPDSVIRALIDEELVLAFKRRALNPDNPFMRGTAMNPDVYFQAREACSAFVMACPDHVEAAMRRFGELTGRAYKPFEYVGAPDAERVIVLMGSGAETTRETVEHLVDQGEKIGMVQVRLYRPFSVDRFVAALPATTKSIAVLDRTKEPGSSGEPLYLDVVNALHETKRTSVSVIGGRYGLGSKEFSPGMVKAIFDELMKPEPKNHFTVGIVDDVCQSHLDYNPDFSTEPEGVHRALFFGLGADGTVGANKNTIKIIGEDPEFYAQGYFVYDSKKSGSQTTSHVRFGKKPIRSAYLIQKAHFIGCHQFGFVNRIDVLENALPGATLLLNSPYGAAEVWDYLPKKMQETILERKLKFFVIDAQKVANETGMGKLTNTIMQTCFFAISGVLPKDEAIARIKKSIAKTYGRKGEEVVQKNFRAVDHTIAHIEEVTPPNRTDSKVAMRPPVADGAPEFVRNVTAKMIAGLGDTLPVSALPIDGTYPTGTSKWEKRDIALSVPVWEPELCIQCGNCSFVCPHAAIRAKLFHQDYLSDAPKDFPSAPIDAKGFPETRYALQIYAEDCTGCGICVEACPALSKEATNVKAINMAPKADVLDRTKSNLAYFETLPVNERSRVDFSNVRGVQFLEPLMEFSGACAGCGETPYLRLLSQLFGDRMLVANATGCSSIYGGNLPTTPWAKNSEGRGPAWSNSLFEDNAEFGLGMRLAADRHFDAAERLLGTLAADLGEDLVDELLHAPQLVESDIRLQRERVSILKAKLAELQAAHSGGPKGDAAKALLAVADHMVRRSVWIVGGDGWAYDIGSGGLDHVLASGRDVNVLVMDTEVYSNTGGQASKATPLAAVAKFANAGKQVGKKDLALQAISYGNVYVARVAFGANPQQTLLALREAEAYKGPSLVLAYSHCIAHGITMEKGLDQQFRAVHSGYWPLVRYNPALRQEGLNPFNLDSQRPTLKLPQYTDQELRYRMLRITNPGHADEMMEKAQKLVDQRWSLYEEMASR
ncbi:MAG: pyruvate:ferredoxin (flavodoxin) oxidoreductase [Armatimonadetes bacterium]|nr:pyruvate:ferredoxin (flavodoxin) oxidoreductase [Armatimonadota bacterium]